MKTKRKKDKTILLSKSCTKYPIINNITVLHHTYNDTLGGNITQEEPFSYFALWDEFTTLISPII